jgi:hypothetical protein
MQQSCNSAVRFVKEPLLRPALGCAREEAQLAGAQVRAKHSCSYDSPAHALSCTAYEAQLLIIYEAHNKGNKETKQR